MPRYIDAEKLEKDGWSASRTYQQDVKTMVYETKKMTDFPTADVVKHGKWIWQGSISEGCWVCSECNHSFYQGYGNENFCPNCGAYMGEETEDGKTEVEHDHH